MLAIETDITISVNRKSDIDLIKQTIISRKIEFPIYIFEYENHYQFNFTSDYAEWELDSAILECFPEYEFTSDLDRGRKEIRLQISRYQSEFSTNGWGRPIENPLDETKYLIKKSNVKPEKFNPKVKVLFEEHEQDYFINIANGIEKTSGKKGFVLLNEFRSKDVTNETEISQDRLYDDPLEAFHSGYYKMQDSVNEDFKKYIENKKKEMRNIQKIPRKIVREFIYACNNSDKEGILKNLAPNIKFEKLTDWQMEVETEGIHEFNEHLDSPSQELCGMDFNIRSSWNIKLPNIIIGLKYFPTVENEIKTTSREELRWVKFLIEGNKIVRVIFGNKYFI